jgi:hypothetical protein
LRIEGLPANFQLALPHALSPLGMAVAEALHLELQDWFEGDRARLAVVINQVDLGGPRQPRAGNMRAFSDDMLGSGLNARVPRRSMS